VRGGSRTSGTNPSSSLAICLILHCRTVQSMSKLDGSAQTCPRRVSRSSAAARRSPARGDGRHAARSVLPPAPLSYRSRIAPLTVSLLLQRCPRTRACPRTFVRTWSVEPAASA